MPRMARSMNEAWRRALRERDRPLDFADVEPTAWSRPTRMTWPGGDDHLGPGSTG